MRPKNNGSPSLGKRVIDAFQAIVAIALARILWEAFTQLGEINALIVGLLLIGASTGVVVISFVIVVIALRRAAISRARARAEPVASESTHRQAALPASRLPVVYTPPPDVVAGTRGWSSRRVILLTFIPAVAAAIAGLVLIRQPACEGAGCEPRPVVRAPVATVDTESHVTLTPEQVERVTLTVREVGTIAENAFGEEARTSLFDPFEFELCDGEVVSTADRGNSYSRQVDAGFVDDIGSWVVSFEGDGAKEVMAELKDAVDACGARTRPEEPQYGDDVVRLSMENDDGNSWEVIFFRRGNVLVEVSSVSEAGDNALRIEQLAEHAETSLLQVLGDG